MRVIKAFALAAMLASPVAAQSPAAGCPPADWPLDRLARLKAAKFTVEEPASRHSLALALTPCLAHPNPALRDGIAFEALATWMRAAQLDRPTLIELREELLPMLASARQPHQGVAATNPDPGFRAPFAALIMAEVARTDRIKPWMTAEERDALVQAAAAYVSGVDDYRAFNDRDGFRHGVAHGADFVLQLALNQAVTKTQLDRLLAAVATQVAPRPPVAYTAGEPDRLARPVLFIAQRGLHTDDEWKAWFGQVLSPAPMASWGEAFSSEAGLAKRHNTRAFLLSVYAGASVGENAGVRQLLPPVREGLKLVP